MAHKKSGRTLDDWIKERVSQLSMGLTELANKAGISKETLLKVRRGEGGYPKTIRNVEAALGWALGSIETIKAGGEPTAVDVDAVLRNQTAGMYAVPSDDPAVQLRDIRQRMGQTAFWREIVAMSDEDGTTLRGSASAS